MVWEQKSAEELVNDAEKRKEGKNMPDFRIEFRHCEVGDLITLLMAGGKLIAHNRDADREYHHIVTYNGYSFKGHTHDRLSDGILNRKYTQ